MKKRALLSVSDKTGLVPFARALSQLGVELIATGGTMRMLQEAGLAVTSVEKITGFPEMLDGRVKTLHPKVHGGILAKRADENHQKQVKEHDIPLIDLVCINLYPFKETIQKSEIKIEEAIEQIDIGGPALLRSSAKNHQDVTVVVDPSDYEQVLAAYEQDGETSLALRQKLAVKVFQHTSSYDCLIAQYLAEQFHEQDDFPTQLSFAYSKRQSLSYGENPHQKAAWYQEELPKSGTLSQMQQLSGKELSFNNLRDLDAAYQIVQEFQEPAFVAVKHSNPCGVGTGSTIAEAFQAAYEADPVSIFGGILCANREIDQDTAQLLSKLFVEVILAPSFSSEALDLLSKKKNLRLLTLEMNQADTKNEWTIQSISGGLLVQERDQQLVEIDQWQCVTKRQPTQAEKEAMLFAWKIVKHVKSNAIVIATDKQTLGIGAGQMNRVGSVALACEQMAEKKQIGALASDAFFPMPDSIELAASYGIQAIVQPGGSIKDEAVIQKADELGLVMMVTGERHFWH